MERRSRFCLHWERVPERCVTSDASLGEQTGVTTHNGHPFHACNHCSDLDEGVANAFRDYLEERGINDELAKYIQACMTDKEQKEYELWMTNISKFLAN